jgi:hypothetical protein
LACDHFGHDKTRPEARHEAAEGQIGNPRKGREENGGMDRPWSEAEGQLPVPCADKIVFGAAQMQSQGRMMAICLKNWRCTIFRHVCPSLRQIVRRGGVA